MMCKTPNLWSSIVPARVNQSSCFMYDSVVYMFPRLSNHHHCLFLSVSSSPNPPPPISSHPSFLPNPYSTSSPGRPLIDVSTDLSIPDISWKRGLCDWLLSFSMASSML